MLEQSRTPGQASIILRRRGVKPLLSKVGGRIVPQKQPPQPPQDDNAQDHSPVSTSDEEEESVFFEEPAKNYVVDKDVVCDTPKRKTRAKSDQASPEKRRRTDKTRGRGRNTASKDAAVDLKDSDDDKENSQSSQGETHTRGAPTNSGVKRKVLSKEDDNIWGPFSQTYGSSQHTKPRTYGTHNIHDAQKTVGKSESKAKKEFKHNRALPDDDKLQTSATFVTPKVLDESVGKQRANFKMPPSIGDDNNTSSPSSSETKENAIVSSGLIPRDGVSSPLSSPPTSPFLASQELTADIHLPSSALDHSSSSAFMCPVCKVPVERDLFRTFAKGHRLRIKDAFSFCIAHKRKSAQEEWTTRKYPSIDWERLGMRMRRHHSTMHAILDKRRPSHYRQELESRVRSGKFRNALRSADAADAAAEETGMGAEMTPGYYGSKGGRKMMDHLVGEFDGKLRRVAAKDSIFTSMGVSAFVQAVLVPELATCLVMEDLDVDEDRAREVLKESKEVGELLNPEEDERVVSRSGDEDESGEEDNDDDGRSDG